MFYHQWGLCNKVQNPGTVTQTMPVCPELLYHGLEVLSNRVQPSVMFSTL